jgi:hypothetical protein
MPQGARGLLTAPILISFGGLSFSGRVQDCFKSGSVNSRIIQSAHYGCRVVMFMVYCASKIFKVAIHYLQYLESCVCALLVPNRACYCGMWQEGSFPALALPLFVQRFCTFQATWHPSHDMNSANNRCKN